MKVEAVGQQRLFGAYESSEGHLDLLDPPLPHAEAIDVMDINKAEMRKSNKPIMEKRRRARINNCLNELKGILLDAMRKDPARHSKLEKADILELTVRHLQNVQRNQLAIAMATDPTVLHRFKNGFSECATEVSRYLGRLEITDPGLKTRMSTHLTGCANGLQQVNPTVVGGFNPSTSYQPPQVMQTLPFGPPLTPPPHPIGLLPPPQQPMRTLPVSIEDLNNNTNAQRVAIPMQSPLSHRRHGSFSAFTSLTGGPGPIIGSPMSTSLSETNNLSLSSGSDSSFISFSSDKTNNTSPIDFSFKATSTARSTTSGVRVLKVEPLAKHVMRTIHSTPTTLPLDKGSMWRPW